MSSARPNNWRSPYHLGSRRANFEAVFGPSPWLCAVPVRRGHSGTGYEFHEQLSSDGHSGRMHDLDGGHSDRDMHDLESGRLLRSHSLGS